MSASRQSQVNSADRHSATIIGAGLAGTLMSILLARRGHQVRAYERLPDMRREAIAAGRSINLALAARGIRALEAGDVMDEVRPLLIPMPGRVLHDLGGKLTFVPYGQREHEVIYSVSRSGLNSVLLDAAERAGVRILFGQTALGADFRRNEIQLREETAGREYTIPLERVIAADGAGSPLRRSMVAGLDVQSSEELLPHGYKELTLPAAPGGVHQVEKHALHIWPRGGFMLIALPNLDGSFTVTLFLPLSGADSFAALTSAAAIESFFERHFADARPLLPNLAQEFLSHPTGTMGTIHTERWSVQDRLLLIGDAAHAITPFHGQGMNCAFEDCRALDALLGRDPQWRRAFEAFEEERQFNTDAIADMAIENYVEMRDTVRDPKFQLQKALSLELERRFPDRFIPRYSMVMFHAGIPYATAYRRGQIQSEILTELTRDAAALDDVDYERAAELINSRLPVIA